MKSIKYTLAIMIISGLSIFSSCSKKKTVTPTAATITGFWHGAIGSSPNQVGIAILIRSNGTVREYDNDFFTTGTTMTAADTASAKFKLEGTYSTSPSTTGTTNIVITYYYSEPNLQHKYTNTGVITGTSSMTGTWKDDYISAGINTTNNFSLTK